MSFFRGVVSTILGEAMPIFVSCVPYLAACVVGRLLGSSTMSACLRIRKPHKMTISQKKST